MEALFDRGLDRRPAGGPARPRRACCACSRARARAADEIVAIVPPDLVEITVEKVAINAVMAGCKPEYLPWVHRRRRGGVHRRVQHPRRARHHDAGRAGRHLQRSGHPSDRDERRRERARAGQPRQLDDRAGAAARRAQRRRRPPGRGRPRRPRQPRQAQLLLPRGRARLALDVARRLPRRARGSRRGDAVRRRGPALHRRSAVARRRPSRQLHRRPACGRCTTRSSCSPSTPSSSSAPSTPASSPRPGGTATG